MVEKGKRVRIRSIEEEVMFKSHMQCCVCKDRGVHIHHLNGDSTNTVEDNLVFLCFAHHEEAERKSPLSRKLTSGVIRKYRDLHYQSIENERRRVLGLIDQPIQVLTENALVAASLTASILLEINKMEAEYYATPQRERADVLGRLGIYAEHTNHRIALAVMQVLSSASHLTRSGMTEGDGLVINSVAYNFFPRGCDAERHEQTRELANLCIDAGNSIVYDAAIHLRDLRVALPGLTLLKFIHREGVNWKIPGLVEDVSGAFDWLEATMSRPGRDDLGIALEMVKFYRTKLGENDLTYPVFPEMVMSAIEPRKVIRRV